MTSFCLLPVQILSDAATLWGTEGQNLNTVDFEGDTVQPIALPMAER